MLPSHSQIREDEDPDELPRFGATDENIADNIVMLDPMPDEIDKSVERLLGTEPIKLDTAKAVDANEVEKEITTPPHDD